MSANQRPRLAAKCTDDDIMVGARADADYGTMSGTAIN